MKCRKLQEGLISDEVSKEFFEADDAYRWELKDKKQVEVSTGDTTVANTNSYLFLNT